MRFSEFVGRLSGFKPNGEGRGMACCPHHEDSSPSLSVSVGKNGGIVLNCFGGCSVEQVLGSMGLDLKDLFDDEKPTPAAAPKPKPAGEDVTVEALAKHLKLEPSLLRSFGLADGTYRGKHAVDVPYFDEDGSVFRIKVRTALGGSPKYGWRPGGEGQCLYGENRLSEARQKKTLIFCEGESDCWSLWAAGATVAMGIPGSQAVEKVLSAGHLQGIEKVWICQDNDKPGEEMVADLVRIIDGLAPEIRPRVVVPPSQFKDVSQWRQSFASLAEWVKPLREAMRTAPFAKDPTPPLVKMSEITRKSINFGWKPYIPQGYGTILAGKPGFGKSFVTAALTAAVSRGSDGPCGTEVCGPANVILMSSEDDIAAVILPRLQRCGADLERIFCFDFEQDEFFLGDAGAQRLDSLCRRYKPGLVILDPIVSFLTADININQANEVRSVLRPVIAVAASHGTSLMMTAHVTKARVDEAMDAVVGSGDFGAAVRSVMITYRDPTLEYDPINPAQGYVIAHVKHNLTSKGKPLRYQIQPAADSPDDGELVWNGFSKIGTDDIRRIAGHNPSQLNAARDFMLKELASGPKKAVAFHGAARTLGYSMELIRDAGKLIGALLDKEVTAEWSWRIPDGTYGEDDT